MSESDEFEEEKEAIRKRKREELKAQLDGDAPVDDGGDASGGAEFDEPIHVESPDHYQRLVSENDVVLVDFYADWCGPCKMIEPTVESIAASTDAVVLKVDIDEFQGLARQSNVRGVPTLVVFEGGQPAERLVGVQDESRLRSVIQKHAA